jgi:hypothetical protein
MYGDGDGGIKGSFLSPQQKKKPREQTPDPAIAAMSVSYY